METMAGVTVFRANVPDSIKGRFEQGDDEVFIPLKALSAEALERLCDEFREDVFKKAGKTPPPRCYAVER